jgi:hypothetical protein
LHKAGAIFHGLLYFSTRRLQGISGISQHFPNLACDDVAPAAHSPGKVAKKKTGVTPCALQRFNRGVQAPVYSGCAAVESNLCPLRSCTDPIPDRNRTIA